MTYKVDLENVRGLIETKTGPFDVVKQVSDGLNLEVSVTVRAGDEITFVKGLMVSHRWAWTQELERAVNPAVRHIYPPAEMVSRRRNVGPERVGARTRQARGLLAAFRGHPTTREHATAAPGDSCPDVELKLSRNDATAKCHFAEPY